ncbi:MAG TPA: ABC transporter permease [Candidatus Magasanikbacteria bacterium]|nr:ABC transporter permease [Candidatus Magasanikbacteria bacterium]
MNKLYLIKSSLNNLFKNKVRSALTILGISIGIVAVIVVMSAGDSLKKFVSGQLEMFGPNLIQIEVKVPSTKKNSTDNAMGLATGVTITTLTYDDAEAIAKLKNVEAISPGLTGQELASFEGQIKKSLLWGGSEDFLKVNRMNLKEGRFFSKEENDGLVKVAVLGSKVKEKLFGDSDCLGKNIKLNRTNYRVIGVFEKQGAAGFMDMDSIIYLPVKTLQKQILGVDHVIFISLVVKDQTKIDDTADEIVQLLRLRHNITSPEKDDFSVTTMAEAQSMIDTIFNGLTILLLALVAISLLVGGVGIMNIMYVTVSERTYEIGLRKSVGATNQDIFFQFLFESLVMTLAAGFVGILVGLFLVYLIFVIAASQGFVMEFNFSLFGILIAIIFSLTVGLIFGLTPARRASLLEPVSALRQE